MATVYTLFASPACDYGSYPAGYVVVRAERSDDGTGTVDPPDGSNDIDRYTAENSQGQVYPTLTQLPNGVYLIRAENAQGVALATTDCEVSCAGAFTLESVTSTAATATGGGTVTVRGSGGAAPLLASLGNPLNAQQQLVLDQQGQLATTFQNVPAGTYPGVLRDSSSQQQSFTVTVAGYTVPVVTGCTDPAADNYDPQATQDDGSCVYTPPPRVAHFLVPPFQSLRFVGTKGPGFDNKLLADETPLDYEVRGYCQKVTPDDTLTVQVQSNYSDAPVVQLRPAAGGAVVLTVTATRVQQGEGVTPEFDVYVKADAVAGRSRVYFNDDALPLPFVAGNRITIAGTGTVLNGTYPVQQVLEDEAAGVPYLLLFKPYPSGAIRVDGTLTTTYKTQVYDTWQAVLDFSTVPRGCYQATVTAADANSDAPFPTATAVSEPIEVGLHPDAVRIRWRNFDNAFGLNYSAGLFNQVRVLGRFFERLPTTEKVVLRNNDGQLQLLKGAQYRKIRLEVLQVPGWLHEVLAGAFCQDFVRIQGVQGTVEGEYTYTPTERYTLGKGEALLELKATPNPNQDDLGDPGADEGPFLLATDKFLLAR